ncbi:hypothetical protein BE221DRAFT_206505 [Ostreococcus tauri]|uniref:Uncharacterized protein n=1 Tax=Ostreococcus tauri TaxID=70448 RepID=A0A1Y5IBP1_OSTTA|nr:hypothetical protein BE221DRAFT_206505 [Ostreococcus tauri]
MINEDTLPRVNSPRIALAKSLNGSSRENSDSGTRATTSALRESSSPSVRQVDLLASHTSSHVPVFAFHRTMAFRTSKTSPTIDALARSVASFAAGR